MHWNFVMCISIIIIIFRALIYSRQAPISDCALHHVLSYITIAVAVVSISVISSPVIANARASNISIALISVQYA